jgi:hypothetical protein
MQTMAKGERKESQEITNELNIMPATIPKTDWTPKCRELLLINPKFCSDYNPLQ